jgi:hypothetical protein
MPKKVKFPSYERNLLLNKYVHSDYKPQVPSPVRRRQKIVKLVKTKAPIDYEKPQRRNEAFKKITVHEEGEVNPQTTVCRLLGLRIRCRWINRKVKGDRPTAPTALKWFSLVSC